MHLKKSLGQHLLVAEPTLEKIVNTLAPTKDDTVLEIGPGTGKLTRHLAKKAKKVIAIEKDPEMVTALKRLSLDNVEIINENFLEINLSSLITEPILFAGNIPYNISSPILFKLRDNRKLFRHGIIVMQKEVAERLVARPSTKDYGVLSILICAYAEVKKRFNISASSFTPPPKVTSSAVTIDFTKSSQDKIEDEILFDKIVKQAFSMRRKMIKNTLSDYLPALEEAKISPSVRAEALNIEDFVRLCEIITGK